MDLEIAMALLILVVDIGKSESRRKRETERAEWVFELSFFSIHHSRSICAALLDVNSRPAHMSPRDLALHNSFNLRFAEVICHLPPVRTALNGVRLLARDWHAL